MWLSGSIYVHGYENMFLLIILISTRSLLVGGEIGFCRLVKRRMTFALLSLLFLVTCTLVAICGHENNILCRAVQGFRLGRYFVS